MMNRHLRFVLVATSLIGVVACSSTGPDPDEGPPPESLRFGAFELTLSARLIDRFPEDGRATFVRVRMSGTNVTESTATGSFAGGCALTVRLYREGEWDEPVWKQREDMPCTADAAGFRLDPGETATPRGWSHFGFGLASVHDTVGLVPGERYRPGGEVYLPDGRTRQAEPIGEIITQEPILLTEENLGL